MCCLCVGCERFTNGFWSLLSQSVLTLCGLRKVYEWVLEPTISKCVASVWVAKGLRMGFGAYYLKVCCLCVGCERFTNGFWSLLSQSVLPLCGLRKVDEWILEPTILKCVASVWVAKGLRMGFGAYYLKVCCLCVGCERFKNGFGSLVSLSVLPLCGLRKVYEWVLEPSISKCVASVWVAKGLRMGFRAYYLKVC